MIQATAPAKIILLGEHAVVYGQPAIAIPVSHLRATASVEANGMGNGLQIVASDLGITLSVNKTGASDDPLYAIVRQVLNMWGVAPPDLRIIIKSDIPVASGLGSGTAISAVLARALAAAIGRPLDNQTLNELVYQVEKLHHGSPSGVDNTVVVYERPVYFVRGRDIDFFAVKGQFHFLIGDTGIAALTRDTVGDVNSLYQARPDHYQRIFNAIGTLAMQARTALKTGSPLQLGMLMNQNHVYLQELTVSSLELDRLVNAARAAGALGAKMSGGGRGGNMIALVSEEMLADVRSALMAAGSVRVFDAVLT